jgi:fermentation-respiration switch protein FrsA (DUF1100 family)
MLYPLSYGRALQHSTRTDASGLLAQKACHYSRMRVQPSAMLAALENFLVFRPVTARKCWVEAPSPQIQDVFLNSADGTSLHAWWLPCPGATETVLYFHGQAGNLSQRGGSILKLRKLLDSAVLIVDYPGYGRSGGRPSEAGCYHAASAAYDWLTQQQEVAPQDIILYGASLGGAVAIELGSRREHRALVLVKTFTTLPEAAGRLHPWLPVRWLMRNEFDSLSRIRRCRRPVFIGHGDADRLVPYSHGLRLFNAAHEPKQFFVMPGEGHHDKMPEGFFSALRDFLSEATVMR